MKLMISKNKDGKGYYTKLTNEYNNEKTEMYLSLQLSKNVGDLEYGLYDVDGFFSCYKSKDEVKPKFIITSAKKSTKIEKQNTTDPFDEMGEQVTIDDDLLD